MELKLLEDFLCLSDLRSFSRSAEERNVTQSSLSKRIRALEQWVGAELVDRSCYPIALTAEGRAMLPQAREIVQAMNEMRAGVRSSDAPSDAVTFAALHTLLVTFMPVWRRRIEAVTGPLKIEPSRENSAYVQNVKMVQDGEVDFLLTYTHPRVPSGFDTSGLDVLTLGRERVLPVSAPGPDGRPLHAIGGEKPIRYLSYGTASFFANALSVFFAERPLPLKVVAANSMSVGLQSMALVGCGLAWVPESLAAEDLAAGRLVLAGGEEWTLQADIELWRRRKRGRPVVERIWQVACDLSAERGLLHEAIVA
ncbi:LysR family transcriptional regulator [Consotaella aegiceratis]|uniref:LysR family transcriptional regulator n=1 Tax=Consotaella aegiceratis TaxID=3097961 RepID=UPI002F3F0CD1